VEGDREVGAARGCDARASWPDRWLSGYAAVDAKTDTDHVEQWNGTSLAPDDAVHGIVPIISQQGEMGSALAAVTTDHAGGLWTVGWTRPAGTAIPSALHRTGSGLT